MYAKILSALVFLLAVPALANAQTDSITETYAPVEKFGTILYDNKHANRHRLGYLLLDANGKPAIYLWRKSDVNADGTLAQLSEATLVDIRAIWNIKPDGENIQSLQTIGWDSEHRGWEIFTVSLKFKNDRCELFKVEGRNVKVTNWLPTNQIPKTLDFSKLAKSALPTPIEIMCVDGPKE